MRSEILYLDIKKQNKIRSQTGERQELLRLSSGGNGGGEPTAFFLG